MTITKVDDNTIAMKGFYWLNDILTGTVDMAAKTITFAAGQTMYTYWTLGTENSVDEAVVATFDDEFTITITGWAPWYGGYPYVELSKTVLTKQ